MKLVRRGKRKLLPLLLLLPAMVALVSTGAHSAESGTPPEAKIESTATPVAGLSADEARKKWFELAREGYKYNALGLASKAELTLKKALELAQVAGASSIPERADLMSQLSQCLPIPPSNVSRAEEQRLKREAEEKQLVWSQRIVDLHKGHPDIHNFALACAYFVIGEVYCDRKQFDRAWPLFDKAMAELDQTPKKAKMKAYWYKLIAEKYDAGGLKEKARSLRKLGIQFASTSADSVEYRRGLIDAVRKDIVAQKFEQPRVVFDKDKSHLAEKILAGVREGDVTDVVFLADSLNDTGMDLLLRKSPGSAIPYLHQAFAVRDKMETMSFQYVRKETKLDTAVTAALLGRALVDTDKPEEALKLLERADAASVGLPSYNWLRSYIYDARVLAEKKLNDAARVKNDSAIAYEFYPEHTFDDGGRWPLYLQAAQRVNRANCWFAWDDDDIDRLYTSAAKDTEKYGENDIRRRLCVVEQTARFSRHWGDDMPKFQAAARALLTMKPPRPKLAVAVVDERTKTISGADFEEEDWVRFRLTFTGEALGKKSPEYKLLLNDYVKSVLAKGSSRRGFSNGEDLLTVVEDLPAVLGADDPNAIESLHEVARYYLQHMKPFEASQYLKRYIDAIRPLGAKKKFDLAESLKEYSQALAQTNDQQGAEQALKEARAITGEPEPQQETAAPGQVIYTD